MLADKENKYIVPINFTIRANKQKFLLKMLNTYGLIPLEDLAQILNVPARKVESVLNDKAWFDKFEVEKLARYFCIFCGE